MTDVNRENPFPAPSDTLHHIYYFANFCNDFGRFVYEFLYSKFPQEHVDPNFLSREVAGRLSILVASSVYRSTVFLPSFDYMLSDGLDGPLEVCDGHRHRGHQLEVCRPQGVKSMHRFEGACAYA